MRYAHHLSGLLRRMGRCEAAVAISERRNALAAQTGGLDAGVQLPAGWNAWRRLVRRASRPWPLLHAAAVDDAAMLVLRGKGTRACESRRKGVPCARAVVPGAIRGRRADAVPGCCPSVVCRPSAGVCRPVVRHSRHPEARPHRYIWRYTMARAPLAHAAGSQPRRKGAPTKSSPARRGAPLMRWTPLIAYSCVTLA